MKTAVKALAIVGIIIGFGWAVLMFFGGIGGEIVEAAFTKDEAKREELVKAHITALIYSILALIPIVAGLVFGLVCAREKSGKVTTIVNGLALLLCGIAAIALRSWIAGPIYVAGGFVGFLAGLMIKVEPKKERWDIP